MKTRADVEAGNNDNDGDGDVNLQHDVGGDEGFHKKCPICLDVYTVEVSSSF